LLKSNFVEPSDLPVVNEFPEVEPEVSRRGKNDPALSLSSLVVSPPAMWPTELTLIIPCGSRNR
jgi:hypothetical protein